MEYNYYLGFVCCIGFFFVRGNFRFFVLRLLLLFLDIRESTVLHSHVLCSTKMYRVLLHSFLRKQGEEWVEQCFLRTKPRGGIKTEAAVY